MDGSVLWQLLLFSYTHFRDDLPLPLNTVYMPKSLKCFSIPDLSSKPQAQIMIYIPNISAGPCHGHLKLNMPQTNLLIPAAPCLPYF